VSNGVASFWNIASAGVQAAGEKFGVERKRDAGRRHQRPSMIEDLLTRGVDGIAVSPIDPANRLNC
jgi:ribose transport system substrate-binding protein